MKDGILWHPKAWDEYSKWIVDSRQKYNYCKENCRTNKGYFKKWTFKWFRKT